MRRLLLNASLVPVAAATAVVTSPAFAQNSSAAETGVTAGFGKIQSIVDLAIPLMIGIAAVVVAAMWGMKMLKRG
jgi:hypothetical protein